MSASTMNGDGTPVTRAELREELAAFEVRLEERLERKLEQKLEQKLDEKFARHRREISLEIASAMSYVVEKNREMLEAQFATQFAAFRREIQADLARATAASAEDSRREIALVDDRYRDLPGRVAALERALDEHRGDPAAHRRPPRRRPR